MKRALEFFNLTGEEFVTTKRNGSIKIPFKSGYMVKVVLKEILDLKC